ncbi:4-hydroxythreonine-4-phosphate dehydrogenase PdxA [Caballeronia sp. GAOx1]|uniref:PdxA family dehydrogenase n=2 Tax=Burkholderiaceae TaxID=119060 RepID=UPI0020289679|nr:4-hydroxythreonine-4-phosphate dehydrogenase PdxA [Caballeronia sp. GAOx1]
MIETTTPAASLPIIAVMVGDPAGIGPEVAVKAASDASVRAVCRPMLIGDIASIQAAARAVPLGDEAEVMESYDEEAFASGRIVVLDPLDLAPHEYVTGQPSAAAGRAVVRWMALADRIAHDGLIGGWIMGPIDSTSLKLAGEVASIDELQPEHTFMFRMSGRLRVVPLTEHIPLRDVPATVTFDAVLNLVTLVNERLKDWGIEAPRIGVAGLNPHAMFEEEERIIGPAVEQARAQGIDVRGPVSPDSVFRHGLDGRYDAVVSMYHDQGQIALKSAAFEGACTLYLGVPYVRATVPHGTAMGIAGRNLAQHHSMVAALRTAAALATKRGFLNEQ